jgi:hypothetical protein
MTTASLIDAKTGTNPSERKALASLGRSGPPWEIDRGSSLPAGVRAAGPLRFSFGFCDVPFRARAERKAGKPVLTLIGDLGVVPFSIQNPRQRRRLLMVVAAAQQQDSSLLWEVTPDHRISLTGEIDLNMPLTPTAVIAAATTLLMRCRSYIECVVAIANEK